MGAMDGAGRIEVICGPMFAGKTEELLRRVRRAALAGGDVLVFGHVLDTRGGTDRLVSHAGVDYPSRVVETAADIEASVPDGTRMVAVDEAQFFGAGLVGVAERLAARGVVVVIAGLDVTFEGRPFEPLPSLMALAERVDKLTAICTVCGRDAVYHLRTVPATAPGDVPAAEHVGALDKYQARCRDHFPGAAGGADPAGPAAAP